MSDTALYTCLAINVAGEAEVTYKVDVQGKEHSILHEINQLKVSQNNLFNPCM